MIVETKNKLDSADNKIIHGDVLDGLKIIPDGVLTLVITSPPYNVNAAKWGYSSSDDNLPYKEYIKWLKEVFNECKRTLRIGGRIIVNIDAMTNRQEDKQDEYVRPIYVDLGNAMRDIGMKFYGEHIWYKSNKDPSFNSGQFNGKKTAWGSYMSPSTPAVRRNHEYILVYSKEQFKLEKSEVSGDPDMTKDEFQNWIASTWSIQPETKNLGNHPVPFPLELPTRCIKLYSYPNDLILDPFMGTGTTLLAAKRLKRRFVGIDLDEGYCKFAERRLSSVTEIDMFEDT